MYLPKNFSALHLIPLIFTLKHTDDKNNIHGLNPHIVEQAFSC
jgi:hypothetical protein